MQPDLAPCVAVVGPANSGKTTLLHLLDRALQQHADQPLAYVVKGSPDGTGRYLFHAPELRAALKPSVKGAWIAETATTVSTWVANCRAHLDLVLLDFGGKHGPNDDRMLERCTHFLVLARNEADWRSWEDACLRCGLQPAARLLSLWETGEAVVHQAADGVLEGTFRADATGPADTANAAAVAGLVERMLALRPRRAPPQYVNLKLARDWTTEDLPDLGGRGRELDRLVLSGGQVVLGGAAPIWAYVAAMQRALSLVPQVALAQFDPKVTGGLVPIPATIAPDADSPLARALRARWEGGSGGGVLRLEMLTGDKMLPADAWQHLPSAPLPIEAGPPPGAPLWTSGAAPIWLHLTYSRWLRQRWPDRDLGVWVAGLRGALFLAGPAAPRFLPCAD